MNMDPQQQYPSGNSPYDFILNPPKSPKKNFLSGLPGGENPFMQKLVLLISGAVLLMIVLAIMISVFTSSRSTDTKRLVDIAQTQAEIIRVADQGVTSASQQNVKNLAITAKFSVRTQQNQLITYLAKQGTKVNAEQLTLKRNASTDQKFTLAKQTSTFDTVFSQTMQTELQAYASSLKSAFDQATGKNQRALLSDDYTQVQLLISQVPSKESLQSD